MERASWSFVCIHETKCENIDEEVYVCSNGEVMK